MRMYPDYGLRVGQYMGSWCTGVLGAALAADAPIAGLRVGATAQKVVADQGAGNISGPSIVAQITMLILKVQSTVAFTATQQFGLYLQRYSAANLAGGATSNPFRMHDPAGNGQASVCLPGGAAGGDLRASTTAALTTAGVTFSGPKIPIYNWATVGPAEYQQVLIDLEDRPIKLGVGDGLALMNQIVWPVAGTAIVDGTIIWDEAAY